VLERLVNARDDVLAGALEVVTTAHDLVPDTAGCCPVPLEQWVDHSLPPLGVRGVYRQQCFCHRGGAGDADWLILCSEIQIPAQSSEPEQGD